MIPGLCNLFQARSSSGMSVIATPTFDETIGNGSTNSGTFTATVMGGTGPYTYSWDFAGGDNSVTPNSAATASTTFNATIGPGDNFLTNFVCNVADSGALTATSNQITVSFRSN